MDPATVFLVFVASVLCLWLVGTVVPPAIEAVSRVGVLPPVGRRFAAVAISLVLVVGATRIPTASGSVGPASDRMTEMVNEPPVEDPSLIASIEYRSITKTGSRSTYTVVKGDSLWRIARELLPAEGIRSGAGISDLWRSIYDLNRAVIGDDPNLIHPGQVLKLPGR